MLDLPALWSPSHTLATTLPNVAARGKHIHAIQAAAARQGLFPFFLKFCSRFLSVLSFDCPKGMPVCIYYLHAVNRRAWSLCLQHDDSATPRWHLTCRLCSLLSIPPQTLFWAEYPEILLFPRMFETRVLATSSE